MDPHTALANMLGTSDPESRARRVAELKVVAVLALHIRTAAGDAERAAHVQALSLAVERLTGMVGADPLPGAPRQALCSSGCRASRAGRGDSGVA